MKKRSLPLWLLLPVLCIGCRTAPQTHQQSGASGVLAEAVCCNDVKKFREPLSPDAQKKFGEKEFADSRASLCRRLGKPVEKHYMGRLRHPFLEIDLWRIAFERQGREGVITRDAVFQVVSAEENGRKQVISFGFL